MTVETLPADDRGERRMLGDTLSPTIDEESDEDDDDGVGAGKDDDDSVAC